MTEAEKDFLTGNITESDKRLEKDQEDRLPPLEVQLTDDQVKTFKQIEKNSQKYTTSEDTADPYDIKVTEEEIKEMQDAQ